jgi:antitoxin PrlF
MLTCRISSKGQITLPRRIRRLLEVQPGEQVVFVVKNNNVVLQPLGPASAKALAGSLSRYQRPGSSTRVRAEVQKEVARAAARET